MHTVRNILIIDDDQVTCFLNRCFFKEIKLADNVLCYDDARKALDFLQQLLADGVLEQLGPDLIFLDINMPGMDGFEFLEKVAQLEGLKQICAQRIVMYTSSVHPRDMARANAHGVLGYIVKPLTEPKMRGLLEIYYKQAS